MLAAQQSMAHLLDAKVMKFGDFANLYLSKKTIPVVKLEKLKTHIQSITDTTPSEQSLYDSIVKQIDARFAGNNSIVDENNAILNNIYQSTKVENSRTSDKLALNPTDAQLVTQYETLLGRSLTPSHIQAIIDAHEA